jgi:hypothetical protein
MVKSHEQLIVETCQDTFLSLIFSSTMQMQKVLYLVNARYIAYCPYCYSRNVYKI